MLNRLFFVSFVLVDVGVGMTTLLGVGFGEPREFVVSLAILIP